MRSNWPSGTVRCDFGTVTTPSYPALDDVPGITKLGAGIPSDPINVALIGTKADLVQVMLVARWLPANPLSLNSSIEIAVDAVFKRPDSEAPVSNQYLFVRAEDFAFEQVVGDKPGRYELRIRTVDKNGFAQPEPRPNQQSGKNLIQCKLFEVK